MNLNSIQTNGASAVTAAAEGIVFLDGARDVLGRDASAYIARGDWPRIKQYIGSFRAVGIKYDIPPAVLAAIASRETHGRNIRGDGGNGIGLMQIDRRYHVFASTKDAMVPSENIEYAGSVLRKYFCAVLGRAAKDFDTEEKCLLGAIAAYNSGLENVRSMERLDVGTTHGDYSSDVWARAQALEAFFE